MEQDLERVVAELGQGERYGDCCWLRRLRCPHRRLPTPEQLFEQRDPIESFSHLAATNFRASDTASTASLPYPSAPIWSANF